MNFETARGQILGKAQCALNADSSDRRKQVGHDENLFSVPVFDIHHAPEVWILMGNQTRLGAIFLPGKRASGRR
jgi:hypothetical protein